MTSAVPTELRRLVAERAGFACEYCGIHESLTYFGCQVDHIISAKHGGRTEPDNLCLACVFCNRFKGSDIGSIDPRTGTFVRFFNPRQDHWHEHFERAAGRIEPRSTIGEATARILRFNDADRILERLASGG
jgi:hypothetical protein